MIRQAALGLVLLLGGCAGGAPPPGPPPAPAAAIPDLRGTWSGTWGGTPLTLVVVEQEEMGASSGVYLGSVQLLGQRGPGIAGVMTSTIGGHAVSASAQGWLGSRGATLTLAVDARTPHGRQWLTLTRVEAHQMAGTGESDFRWGPRGDVQLVPRPATPAGAWR